MTSAPSCASRTAWLRPWPRAAPVMNATLPSSLPTVDLLVDAGADEIDRRPPPDGGQEPGGSAELGTRQRGLVAGLRGHRRHAEQRRLAAHRAGVRMVQMALRRERRAVARGQGGLAVALH